MPPSERASKNGCTLTRFDTIPRPGLLPGNFSSCRFSGK
jgi:hypothetical protein